jgi:hypothetical protein
MVEAHREHGVLEVEGYHDFILDDEGAAASWRRKLVHGHTPSAVPIN